VEVIVHKEVNSTRMSMKADTAQALIITIPRPAEDCISILDHRSPMADLEIGLAGGMIAGRTGKGQNQRGLKSIHLHRTLTTITALIT
jgi:hypothetical protein